MTDLFSTDIPRYTNNIPGYTGYVKPQTPSNSSQHPSIKPIPGYGGYIPHKNSENIYGKSFGSLQKMAKQNQFKFNQEDQTFQSVTQAEFSDPKFINPPSAAEIVGVKPKPKVFKEPFSPESLNKFWGIPLQNQTEKDKQIDFEKSAKKFFETPSKLESQKVNCSLFDDNCTKYFGIHETSKGKLSQPISGYMGYRPRVQADNIFGKVFKDELNELQTSNTWLSQERKEAYKKGGQYIPEYVRKYKQRE